MDFAPIQAPTAVTPPSPEELAKRKRIEKTAHDFEASFVSVMLNQMFEGVSTDGPFGGGHAEGAMRSFLTEAMGKGVAAQGGFGLAPAIQAQMLKMEGLG